MTPISVGDVTIQPIVEFVEKDLFKLDKFLPTLERAQFEEHLHWIDGHSYDSRTNKIFLSIHAWLVRTAHHTVLIDTCVGNDKPRAGLDKWDRMQTAWLDKLAAAGVAPEDVDYVMCTHMHVDHVGWNTRLQDGRWVPTFPNARYLFCQQEYDHFRNLEENEFARVVYDDSVLPVIEAGQALIVEDGHNLDDTFSVDLAPGHTPGSIAIELEDKGKRGLFTGDIIHHPIQVYYPDCSSRACLDFTQSAATRRRILSQVAETGALLLPAHFTTPHAGHVRAGGDAFTFHWLGEE